MIQRYVITGINASGGGNVAVNINKADDGRFVLFTDYEQEVERMVRAAQVEAWDDGHEQGTHINDDLYDGGINPYRSKT